MWWREVGSWWLAPSGCRESVQFPPSYPGGWRGERRPWLALPPSPCRYCLNTPCPQHWLPLSRVSPCSLIYFQEGVWKTWAVYNIFFNISIAVLTIILGCVSCNTNNDIKSIKQASLSSLPGVGARGRWAGKGRELTLWTWPLGISIPLHHSEKLWPRRSPGTLWTLGNWALLRGWRQAETGWGVSPHLPGGGAEPDDIIMRSGHRRENQGGVEARRLWGREAERPSTGGGHSS